MACCDGLMGFRQLYVIKKTHKSIVGVYIVKLRLLYANWLVSCKQTVQLTLGGPLGHRETNAI